MLLYFLNIYLSKQELKMKDLVINIKSKLKIKKPIIFKKFTAVIKFLQREQQFRDVDRSKIIDYFSPLIKGYRKNDDRKSNTLQFT